jgi:hypothetical protein
MRAIIILFFLISKIGFSQISAVTSNGDEVILYKNGTWKYASKNDSSKEIPMSSVKFEKDSKSTFQVKSNVIPSISIYINPKIWSFEKPEDSHSKEYKFQLKGKEAYGMLITERVELPLETLREAALTNAKSAAPDIEIIEQEYRVVNGTKVLFMRMDGTISGMEFSYYGYYYSSKSGSVQFITYTFKNLLTEFRADLESILNGLVVKE